MENIPLILDRILLFAAHKAYSLAAGLELLCVAPRMDATDAHCHIIRRLADVHDLGHGGRLELIQVLGNDISDQDIRCISEGAATAGQVHILDWILLNYRPGVDLQKIELLAVMHGRASVLDWRIAHNVDLCSDLGDLFLTATQYCQLPSLERLKTYAVKRKLEYAFLPSSRLHRIQRLPVDRRIAMLDWWKTDYATRSDPKFPENCGFSPDLASCSDDGLPVVHWWQTYCAETGREFTWPKLNPTTLHFNLVRTDSLQLLQWWWGETVQQHGIHGAKFYLQDILDAICEGGLTPILDWYWDLCANSNGAVQFAPRNWRPRHPFIHMSVIRWWEAKVESGQAKPSVFHIVPKTPMLSNLDMIFETPINNEVSVTALDWWWARRERFGLKPSLSIVILPSLVRRRDPELLSWYLDRCTDESRLPDVSIDDLASLVSRGRVDLIEKLWQLSLSFTNKPLTIYIYRSQIGTGEFNKRVSASAVLDYLWDICTRAGMRFTPCHNPWSAIWSMDASDLGAAKWWYAMHRVHDTVFPSIEQLGNVKCALDSQMAQWIRSIQSRLQ
ncbi:hypothetical protein BC828DRAFT_375130 [Blastocladiella britannica]|nr:hypothetical protein BC828DRAFT_375130 [Blastocladiella britannica]